MHAQPVVDVASVVEQQKLSKFLVRLVLISWVVTFFDGFDMNVISFAAPYMVSHFHLSKLMMGNVFSAGLFGTVFGAFLFGYIGDKIGRRKAIILATSWFGVATFAFTLAPGYEYLVALRFIDGIAMGGFLPLIWSLNIEYAPKRYRSTLVTLNMVGYSCGVILGGPISIALIPRYGWQSVFILGGVLTLIATLVLWAVLPESIRFLASKGRRPDLIAKLVQRIAPDRVVPGARFVVADEGGQGRKFTPKLLFAGELRWVTPLLWVAYASSSLTTFFITSWTPMFFEAMKFTRSDAAWASSIAQTAAMLGSMALMRFTDNLGAIAITVMPAIAIPLMLIAGLFDFGQATFFVLYALIVTFIISGQNGMHSIAGVFYPSAYRSNGTGWASAIAKIGATLGPMVGGLILSSKMPARNVLAVLVIFPLLLGVCVVILGRIHRRILGREAMEAPTDPALAKAAAQG